MGTCSKTLFLIKYYPSDHLLAGTALNLRKLKDFLLKSFPLILPSPTPLELISEQSYLQNGLLLELASLICHFLRLLKAHLAFGAILCFFLTLRDSF